VKAFLAAAALLLVAGAAAAQDRAIPFWPDAVPAAIHAEVDGGNALETVRELARFHRVQGSPEVTEYFDLLARAKAVTFR
jgi:hypothetical protein